MHHVHYIYYDIYTFKKPVFYRPNAWLTTASTTNGTSRHSSIKNRKPHRVKNNGQDILYTNAIKLNQYPTRGTNYRAIAKIYDGSRATPPIK